jgi:hypothetical protein
MAEFRPTRDSRRPGRDLPQLRHIAYGVSKRSQNSTRTFHGLEILEPSHVCITVHPQPLFVNPHFISRCYGDDRTLRTLSA